MTFSFIQLNKSFIRHMPITVRSANRFSNYAATLISRA